MKIVGFVEDTVPEMDNLEEISGAPPLAHPQPRPRVVWSTRRMLCLPPPPLLPVCFRRRDICFLKS